MTDKKLILSPGEPPEFVGEWSLKDIIQIINQLQASVDKILTDVKINTEAPDSQLPR